MIGKGKGVSDKDDNKGHGRIEELKRWGGN